LVFFFFQFPGFCYFFRVPPSSLVALSLCLGLLLAVLCFSCCLFLLLFSGKCFQLAQPKTIIFFTRRGKNLEVASMAVATA
jgi:hypothetical protein